MSHLTVADTLSPHVLHLHLNIFRLTPLIVYLFGHNGFLFFFSSRRRHTRSDRDWSSDVCSSDRSEEHTSELQSRSDLVCRLLLVTGVQTCALPIDRKSTRLNSSHDQISYAVFCLKKKKNSTAH